jgi:hypothetical protein
MHSAFLGYITRHHMGARTCVYEDANSSAGLAQVWPRPDHTEWDLAFLSPSLDHSDHAVQIWQRLLSHLIIVGAERGILRIYARSSEDSEIEEVLRQVGFTVVTREEIFVLSQPPAPAPLPKGLRRVDRDDLGALDAFYCQVMPRMLHQAASPCPYSCASAAPHRTVMSFVSVDEFVWTEKGKIIAYLGLYSSPKGYWLDVVVRPEYRADVLPYIKYVLALTECSPGTPVYSPVFDYSVGLGWLLRTLGFESFTRQVLLVAHTMACIPIRRQVMIRALERGIDVGTSVGHMFDERELTSQTRGSNEIICHSKLPMI